MNGKDEASSFTSIGLFKSADSLLYKGTLTTEQGDYTFQNIPEGSYYLSVSTMGYRRFNSKPILISKDTQLNLGTTILERENFQLNEVSIVSKKPLIENLIDKTVLNIENSVLAAGNTALELLQKAPGVSVDNKQLSLRGKSNVMIMIDGKSTYLSQDEVANLLASTQSSAIQSIEIITNPSSKYDAAGNAGIINIKMKKNQNYGTNGSINLSEGQGKYRKTNGGIALTHMTKAINIFASYNYSDNVEFDDLAVDRYVTNPNESTLFSSESFAKYRYKTHNFKFGTDFSLGKQSSIGFIISGNLREGSSNQISTNLIGSQLKKTDSAVVGINTAKYPNNYLTYNLNYRTVFDTVGTELTLSADYSSSRGKEKHDFSNRFFDQNLNENRTADIFRNYTPADADIYVVKGDFSHPINKTTKFETGLKYSSVKTDNNLIFSNLSPGGTYDIDPWRSNHFLYTENIAAAYLNFNKEFGSYNLQAGLRAESTRSLGNSITETNEVRRNYTDLFPTIFIQRSINDNNKIGLKFGRRIDRPNYASLNPFVYYIDQYTSKFGNPYLKPQYTTSYELNYILKGKYTMSLGYKHTSDAITFILLTDPGTKAITQTDANLNSYNYYNLNLNAPISITKWWNTYNNLTVFYNQYDSGEIDGAPNQLQKLAYQVSTSQSFTINESTNLELSGNYFSSSVYGVFNLKSFYGVDLGLGKSLFSKSVDIKLAVNDIFNTRGKKTTYSTFPNSAYNIRTAYDSRVVRISAAYRFGNSKLKSINKKGTANEEERRLN